MPVCSCLSLTRSLQPICSGNGNYRYWCGKDKIVVKRQEGLQQPPEGVSRSECSVLLCRHGHNGKENTRKGKHQGKGTRNPPTFSKMAAYTFRETLATKPRLERTSHTEITNRKRWSHHANIEKFFRKSTRTHIWLYRMCHAGLDGMWNCMFFKKNFTRALIHTRKCFLLLDVYKWGHCLVLYMACQ